MGTHNDIAFLERGLRALAIVADHAPVDIATLARIQNSDIDHARALMHIFVSDGYARPLTEDNLTDQSLFVLTPLAIGMVESRNYAGNAVGLAMDMIEMLSLRLACPTALSIRRGGSMLTCIASRKLPAILRPECTTGLLDDPAGLVHLACAATGAIDHVADLARRMGFAMGQNIDDEAMIAVPVMMAGQVAAVVSAYPNAAHPDPVKSVFPSLADAALSISAMLRRKYPWPDGQGDAATALPPSLRMH